MERNMKLLSQRGFSLLEVIIAIGIFAIGMLALASFQGSLTRSSSDANLRMVAANIAERTVEELRAFGRIDVDPDESEQAYGDILTAAPETVTHDGIPYDPETDTYGGIPFIRTINVSDYFFVLAQDKFLSTAELDADVIDLGVAVSDFKLVEVNVSWGVAAGDNAGFQLDESQDVLSSGDLGSGDITVSTLVSSITTRGSARVSSQGDESPFQAVVEYNREDNRELIALKLGEGKLKESLTPEPDVTLTDELIETRFDVITYSQNGLFLRREEFAVVSCECTFETGVSDGRRPVIWAGDEYVRGQNVQKTHGESSNNQQSPLCVACCGDHHDGGSDDGSTIQDHSDALVNVYDPFRPSTEYILGGDHAHYNRTASGLQRVTSGDYVEACRLVRQDGFFRVAQDFRREDLNVFPDDFLDDTGLIDLYSSYVTGAISALVTATGSSDYTGSPTSCIGSSPCAVDPAPKQGDYDAPIATEGGNPTQLPSWTTFPTVIGVVPSFCTDLGLDVTCQQLTSRGVYLDYLSEDLRTVLTNCTSDKTPDDPECKSGDVELDRTGSVNPLELIPFFDVQMTKLNRWNEAPANNPVDTFNEQLETGNNHDRGVVFKVSEGESTVVAKGHRGNIGFTDSFPIDSVTRYYSQVTDSSLVVHAGSASAVPTGTAILGSLSHLIKFKIDIIVEGLNGVECGQTTVDYGCSVPASASNPQIKLSGYGKNDPRFACSIGTYLGTPVLEETGAVAFAIFDLSSVVEGSNYNFLIVEEPDVCPLP